VAPGQLPAWLTSYAPDLFGLVAPRFATQALGIALSLAALAAVAVPQRGRKWAAGAYGLYALSLAALIMFGLSFTRGDPAPMVRGYRLDSIGSAIVLLAVTGLWLLRVRGPAAFAAPEAPAPPMDTITQP
jgi:hypothetical protein